MLTTKQECGAMIARTMRHGDTVYVCGTTEKNPQGSSWLALSRVMWREREDQSSPPLHGYNQICMFMRPWYRVFCFYWNPRSRDTCWEWAQLEWIGSTVWEWAQLEWGQAILKGDWGGVWYSWHRVAYLPWFFTKPTSASSVWQLTHLKHFGCQHWLMARITRPSTNSPVVRVCEYVW